MAKLNPALISSMTRELSELHEIGQEMIELIGSCKIISWRYPGIVIEDVKIDVEKNLFDSAEKYVLLLELIIDRLYLIINITIEIFNFLPELSKKNVLKLPKNVCKPSGLSFGTLISFFWKRLKILIEAKDIKFSSQAHSKSSIQCSTSSSTENEVNLQPCASCGTAMQMVKTLINTVEECMNNLKLASALVDNRLKMEQSIFNLTQYEAMQQWCEYINADVKILTIFANKKMSENFILNQNFEKFKTENTTILIKLKMSETKQAELEQLNRETQSTLIRATNLNENYTFTVDRLNADLRLSEDNCKIKTDKISNLENRLQQTISENNTAIQNLNTEFNSQLNNARTKIDYWEAMYNKTLTQLQKLEESVELKESETKKNEIQNDNEKQKLCAELEKIKYHNSELMQEVENLKEQIQDQSAIDLKINIYEDENIQLRRELSLSKERENKLLQCPDLNGPINIQKGTQNPFEDMKQQLEVNEVRINLLQEQNSNLRRTIEKMRKLNRINSARLKNNPM